MVCEIVVVKFSLNLMLLYVVLLNIEGDDRFDMFCLFGRWLVVISVSVLGFSRCMLFSLLFCSSMCEKCR